MRRVAGMFVAISLVSAALGWLAGPAGASPARAGSRHGSPVIAGGHGQPLHVGKAWRAPASPPPSDAVLPTLSTGGGPGAAAMAAAAAKARRTGKRVLVSSMTTQTMLVWARPGGGFTVTERVLPVRVKQGRRWVPVSTRLVRGAGGGLVPAAVPGDAVWFSGGGSGPAVVLAAAGHSLRLWWPGRLPAPVVAGSSATYRNVLPGVDLVLTATSRQAGGFSEGLVVRTAAAARDPRLAGLTLRVAVPGGRLAPVPGGGLTAVLPGWGGAFVAPAPMMWDSSKLPAGRVIPSRSAAAEARSAGASLAPVWAGRVSSSAGPGGGAMVAPVRAVVSAGGTRLRLVPDQRLLASPSVRLPLYIDPSFTWYVKTGSEQANDAVQSDARTGACSPYACDNADCRGPHYNSYQWLPIGFNNFQGSDATNGNCEFNDTDYALYRVGIPSQVIAAGAHLHSADVQLTEVWTSTCPVAGNQGPSVTVSWIGGIGPGTGWPGPGKTAENVDSSHAFAQDSGSCPGVGSNTNSRVSQGFSILGDMSEWGSATAITIRAWEPGDTNDGDHKLLTPNPTIQFSYNDTPSVPSHEEESASSSGAGNLACVTNPGNPNLPIMGKTDSVNGPFLLAVYGDPDGDSVSGTAQYWYNSSPASKHSVPVDVVSGKGSAQIPASFTSGSGVADGTIIGWDTQASDGTYSSAWSSPCYFTVWPKNPDPPAVTAGFDQTRNQLVGTPLTFTITQSSTVAAEFVWGLDTTPPTSGTIPGGQVCTPTSTTCKLSGGKATLTITAPAPGPHILWVYERDPGGNNSGFATGALAGNVETFDVAGDPNVSYTSGSSLAANFAAALGAGQSFDNTMISSSSGGSCGAAAGDGGGNQFDAGELASAGWVSASGQTLTPQPVTVDGTSFTLASAGSCRPDNLLAADQTIGAGPNGAQGSSLVFLATSSEAFAEVPGQMTGSLDSVTSTTAPAVMGDTGVTGSGCTGSVQTDVTLTGMCTAASGTITYVAGQPNCPSATSFDLTVPDWWQGPSDIAALTMPDVTETTGVHSQQVKLYAFSVPIRGCTIASVTLPDVGSTTSVPLTSGVSKSQPGLHIFGVSVRNTTTATPQVNGTGQASPSQQGWTGAFEAPMENAYVPPGGFTWGNQTFRIAATPNLGAPQGSQIRVRLSFPGFLSQDGTGPLQIGAASIAQGFYGPMPAQTPVPLTFGGSASVNIPEGGDVYSDPLTIPASFGANGVNAGKSLYISLWIKNSSLPVLPQDSLGTGSFTWFSANGTGNQTADASGNPFTATGASWIGGTPILTGIDVTTPAVTGSSPSAPTVVVAGNTIVDGWDFNQEPSDVLNSPSQRLAGQLASQGLAPGYGVVDASVETNQVLASSGGWSGGPSLIARIDRDVLAEPDVGTVVISQGLEDLLAAAGSNTSGTNLSNALNVLVDQLNANGIAVIVGTLTPCSGYDNTTHSGHSCTTGTGATVDAERLFVNSQISNISGQNCWADFDSAVTTPGSNPETLATTPTSYDSGDHANLTLAGFAALAPSVFNGPALCTFAPPLFPLPASP